MGTIIHYIIDAILLGAILYAHRKHSDALEEVKNSFASMRREFNKLTRQS